MGKFNLFVLSAFSGILLSLPWLIEDGSWVLLFALVPLLLAEHWSGRMAVSQSNLLPFVSFLIWNSLSCWWISYVSFAGMLTIVLCNSLLMSVVWLFGTKFIKRRGNVTGYFPLIVFWISFEYLNHWGPVPWPWLTLGNGFANSVKMIQWYEFTGVLGGTFWILLSNFLIFSIIYDAFLKNSGRLFRKLSLLILLVGVPLGWSLWRYATYPKAKGSINAVVLQPNIDPYTEKFSQMSKAAQVERLVCLAESSISDSVQLLLAPETALPPLNMDSLSERNKYVAPFLCLNRQYPKCNLVLGAVTYDKNASKQYNSVLLINDSARVQVGHKNILVAGVEKDPFHLYFPFLPEFLIYLGGPSGGLTEGDRPVVFSLDNRQKAGIVICFESVFSRYVRDLVSHGANYLIVITNDGWWKRSPGVWQHFGFSKLRAIETRRSVVCSANTGISGGIDPIGEVIASTATGEKCAIGFKIPESNDVSMYVKYGDCLGWLSLFFSAFIVLSTVISGLVKKNPH
jgi:apolipoprotein N-acyltransferase